MLDYTQSFEEFASSLGPTDVALYAGVAIVLWVLFKDKLNPVKVFVNDLFTKVTGLINNKSSSTQIVSNTTKQDLFFRLVSSWKQTRDLAVQSGCTEAVKVADQMFPFLSPTGCVTENKDVV